MQLPLVQVCTLMNSFTKHVIPTQFIWFIEYFSFFFLFFFSFWNLALYNRSNIFPSLVSHVRYATFCFSLYIPLFRRNSTRKTFRVISWPPESEITLRLYHGVLGVYLPWLQLVCKRMVRDGHNEPTVRIIEVNLSK